ncbi:MAG TPA: DUF4386 domain-containing protein [Chloroflexota bacterium]|nr:DUF4386 domain-containing protein [Chloroflexota bacterium]HUM69369.1 DUF4386 domain-containing protein [Chloroflexota bacterium]
MNPTRKTSIMVGILYIIGTVAGVLSVLFTNSILQTPDYLAAISANGNRLIVGALLVLTMGLALAMIPVLMFPITRKHDEALALGYVVFRGALETVTYMAIAVGWLLLLPLSQEYVQAGAANVSTFQALGALIMEEVEISAAITAVIFPLGALMFYALLYQSKLIPRWLSVWGLIAVILHFLSTGLAGMFGLLDSTSPIQVAMNLPIFLQEMVMAVWLIVKGFNSSAITAGVDRLA